MILRRFGIGMVLALMLANCAQPQQALPTLMPSATPVLTATPAPVQTQPPTPVPLSRPTLPPTWTPSPEPTLEQANAQPLMTSTPEPVVNQPPVAPVTALPTLEVCGVFTVDRERSAVLFPLGSAPQVFWRAVTGASRYRIRLIDANGTELFVDYTVEPNYTFRADLFQKDTRYGWTVYPEDQLNQQMCFDRGQEIIPQ